MTTTSPAVEHALQSVQVAYPQVYLACHTRHQRKRTTSHALSARDSSILAHLDARTPTTPAKLARHLGVARSTLSEAVKRLTTMGYTAQTPRTTKAGNRGGVGLSLTDRGLQAIRETSVLEEPRLRAILQHLNATELRDVARGMNALAAACSAYASVAHDVVARDETEHDVTMHDALSGDAGAPAKAAHVESAQAMSPRNAPATEVQPT